MFKQISILISLSVFLFAFPEKRYVQKKYYIPSSNFSMGIITGSETGITFKLFASKKVAFSGAFAKIGGDSGYEYANLNYLLHDHTYFDNPSMSLYYGFGIKGKNYATATDKDETGFRIPIGVTYIFTKSPFDFFIELAPEIDTQPESKIGSSFFTGGRFWF